LAGAQRPGSFGSLAVAYPGRVRFDVVVVGGGTAGCVIASRLSEDPDRTVCLIEAGPDYGPFDAGRWPADLLDPRGLTFTHDWGAGGEDERSLGARVIGGCSVHNACMAVAGTPQDYDEWGDAWRWARLAPYVARARAALGVRSANTSDPAPFHLAFLEAAASLGLPVLDDADDPARPTGAARLPVNVTGETRWNAAFAYLDPARGRPNLTIRADLLVDRISLEGTRATGVVTAPGETVDADVVVLTAGAYFTPAILMRSGIGPESELERHGTPVAAALPVGEALLDHHGTGIAWQSTEMHDRVTADHVRRTGPLFKPHALVKAASTACANGGWDTHLVSWTEPGSDGEAYEPSVGVFHMKPRSRGRVRLRSRDPHDLPQVERGFLRDPSDLRPIVEGLELARSLAREPALAGLLGPEKTPGDESLESYAARMMRNYFHPAGTCGIGRVVDASGRVLGVEQLFIADASIMPTMPRANTNLTTAAIAERLAEVI
jgi:choline dehydrogenase